jgi:hypothetical protein
MSPVDWIGLLGEISRFYRLGMEGFASVKLRREIDLLITHLPYLSAGTALRVQEILAETLAAQERKDYLLVADWLEYQLAPLLQQELCGKEA